MSATDEAISTQDLIARRSRLLGPAYRLFYDQPVQFVRGEGVWLYDAAGHRYLDAYNNVASVGHCHPHVVQAIARQAAVLNTHTRYLHETVLDFAEKLLATFPPQIGHVMFTCTGSEANDLALRVARTCTGGTGFIVTANAYHGVTSALAEQYDERLDPWYYRVGKAFWHGSIERLPSGPNADSEIFDSERMASFVRDALLEATESGNCVVVGRGAACVLNSVPGAFHVFIYASLARRVRWFEKNFPEHAKVAEQEILATDKRRAAYVRRFHDRDWNDRRLYHLMMNSCMGCEAMAKATVEAAGLADQIPEATPVAAGALKGPDSRN